MTIKNHDEFEAKLDKLEENHGVEFFDRHGVTELILELIGEDEIQTGYSDYVNPHTERNQLRAELRKIITGR